MMGKNLATHQTGPEDKRLYIEEASDISEFYLFVLLRLLQK